MNATLRPSRSSLVPVAALAVASAVAITVFLGKRHIAAGPDMGHQAVVATVEIAALPQSAATPLALPETVPVTEVDPAAFDRAGVESWWAHYSRAHAVVRQ